MAVLHELREQMRELVPTLGHVLPEGGYGKMVTLRALDVFHALDDFEAAHPGLVDFTLRCRECGRGFTTPLGRVTDVCPVCAKATP